MNMLYNFLTRMKMLLQKKEKKRTSPSSPHPSETEYGVKFFNEYTGEYEDFFNPKKH